MASPYVQSISRLNAWWDVVSIPYLGWLSFVLLHRFLDPFAADMDLPEGVVLQFEGYTIDLYASRKTRKCPLYARYLGGNGSIGDARSLKQKLTGNYWVCPPLTQLRQAIMRILESGVSATIVVPDWPNMHWHVLLRHHAMLKWNANLQVMWDVCVQSSKHVHLVDKWDFIAFAVGGSEDMFGMTTWEQQCRPVVSGRARLRIPLAMWSAKHQRRAIKMDQQCFRESAVEDSTWYVVGKAPAQGYQDESADTGPEGWIKNPQSVSYIVFV